MRSLDIVGYGNLLTLDGFRGKAGALGDAGQATELLTELGDLLEPGLAPDVHVHDAGDGISAAVRSPEGHIALHTFPGLERLAFRAFSRRILPVITLSERVRVRFGIGRMESELRHRATMMPTEDEVPTLKVLAGERAYARLRLGHASKRSA